MGEKEFTERLQKLLDDMRQEIESNLSEDVEKLKQKEVQIDNKELQQEKKLEEVDPCEEALIASEEYWELATQMQILAVFGGVPDDLWQKSDKLEARIKKMREKCRDDSKVHKIDTNVKEAEKRLKTAEKAGQTLDMSIEKMIQELEEFN